MKTIKLKQLGRLNAQEKFDAAFKEALERLRREFVLDSFCQHGGDPTNPDFYQVELKRFSDRKAVGVIHLSFIERLKPTAEVRRHEKHHHVRYGFQLDRSNGDLNLGKGFLRT